MPATHSMPPGAAIFVRMGDETHRATALDHRNPPKDTPSERRRECERLRTAYDSGRYVFVRLDDGDLAYVFARDVIGQRALDLGVP